jgi:hypothetical protein
MDNLAIILAPQVGLEPTTLRLTAECSAIELLRSVFPANGAPNLVRWSLSESSTHFHGKELTHSALPYALPLQIRTGLSINKVAERPHPVKNPNGPAAPGYPSLAPGFQAVYAISELCHVASELGISLNAVGISLQCDTLNSGESSMPRISRLDHSQVPPEIAALYDKAFAHRGNVPNMFRVMAHRPEIFSTMQAHFSAVLNTGTVSTRLKETVFHYQHGIN